MTAVSALAPGERGAAARVCAEAFLDDPGWAAVAPRGRGRRRSFVRRVCAVEMLVAPRLGGRTLVTRDDGAVSGVLVLFEDGTRPLPWWTTALEAPAALLAGPGAVRRGLAAEQALEEGHPAEPHLYVSTLAVSPALQRGGRGRALLTEALGRADELGVPAYLDTARPENVPYYRSFGFRETGRGRLPLDTPLWYLLRDR